MVTARVMDATCDVRTIMDYPTIGIFMVSDGFCIHRWRLQFIATIDLLLRQVMAAQLEPLFLIRVTGDR
jgi:hypothetical protein